MNNLEKVALILWVLSISLIVIFGNAPSWQMFIFSVLTGFCIVGIAWS